MLASRFKLVANLFEPSGPRLSLLTWQSSEFQFNMPRGSSLRRTDKGDGTRVGAPADRDALRSRRHDGRFGQPQIL